MGRCLCGLLGATVLFAGCAAPDRATAPGTLARAEFCTRRLCGRAIAAVRSVVVASRSR